MMPAVLKEVPIDGIVVHTRRGAWQIEVRRAWKALDGKSRNLDVHLIGNPGFELHLRIEGEMPHGDAGRVLDAIKKHLDQPIVPEVAEIDVAY